MFILLFPKVQQSQAFYILLRNNQLHFLCILLYFSENSLHKKLPHIKLLCVWKWVIPMHLETIDPVGWISWENRTPPTKKFFFYKTDRANTISNQLSACWFLSGCYILQTIWLQIRCFTLISTIVLIGNACAYAIISVHIGSSINILVSPYLESPILHTV